MSELTKVSILTGTNSRNGGGLFNSVKSLAKHINNDNSIDLSILSHNDKYSEEDIHTWGDLNMLIYNIVGPQNLGISTNLFSHIKNLEPNIIHQQGIWTYASKCSLRYKSDFNIKTIITPRGMLDTWAINNSSFKKKIIGHWYEYSNLKSANCIHALCYSEYLAIRQFDLKNPVAIIPNGINLPKKIIKNSYKSKKQLLFISRIHPKKGLKVLLNAFVLLKKTNKKIFQDWQFIVAGWSQNNHEKELVKYCDENDLNSFVKFIGPVYGKKKSELLSNSDIFILPSYSEGLPMSILEAWSFKLPVIMTESCNLSDGFKCKAAYKITHNVIEIKNKLIKVLTLPKKSLELTGENGYDLVKQKYTWSQISSMTIELYSWILGNKQIPNFVKID